MHRRDALRLLSAAAALPFLPREGEAAVALGRALHRRLTDVPFRTLDAGQQALVTAVAELIIPETDIAGATAVKVPEFIDLLLTEWAPADEKAAFLAGLGDLDARAAASGGGQRFVELAPAQQTKLLTALDAARGDKAGAGFAFGRLKALTVYGYFTARVVDEQVLKTQLYFGSYRGDVPFTPAT
jgi:glucoside 3-dehydrogenase (cytochrome c) hitch-hiker subunit